MTKSKDCPLKSNNEVRAEFLDIGMEHGLTGIAKLNALMALVANAKGKVAVNEAHNATRLHTRNIAERREACDAIDEHRATEEGKVVYNAKRRDEYVPVGEKKREYVTGLSEEEKDERRRLQKRADDKERAAKMTTAEKSAKRAASRRRKKEREAAEAEASIAARKIF